MSESEQDDGWRSLLQCLPLNVYERWQEQMKRIARVNGISTESFSADDKFLAAVGPRVCAYELLTILLERSEDEALRV